MTFLIVGLCIIIFLGWLIVNKFDLSALVSSENDDVWLEELGLSVNIWPDGEPSKDQWSEIMSDCLPRSDNLSQARCSYVLEQINSFDDCLMAGFSIMESDPEQCRTIDDRLFINE